MVLKKMFCTEKRRKIGALLLAALFSMAVLTPVFCNPWIHAGTYKVLDGNKEKAMMLTTVVTLASTVISAIPDDTASPLADELADLSAPLMVVVCILFFEKYLLTVFELAAFFLLLPIGCGALIFQQLTGKPGYRVVAKKLFLIAVVCALIIPVSTLVSSMIETAFSQTIDDIFVKVKNLSSAFSQMSGSEDTNAIVSFFSGLSSGISSILDIASDLLNIMIDGVAILLITSCIMPVLTVVLFVYSVKSIINGKMESIQGAVLNMLSQIQEKSKEIENKNQNKNADFR